jgi:hypothetical protein
MERDATPETEPNESTKEAERAEAVQTHSPDRPPTAEEAEAAERAKASSDVDQEEVAKHFEEMSALGAQVKGEGEIK